MSVTLAGLCLLLGGCGKDTDAWVNVPGTVMGGRPVSAGDFAAVQPQARASAVAMLNTASVVDLTPQQAEAMAGLPATTAAHMGALKPFLVRAVSFSDDKGGFNTLADGNGLYVYYTTIGTGWRRLQHDAVVVYLPQRPRTIYTSASVAS